MTTLQALAFIAAIVVLVPLGANVAGRQSGRRAGSAEGYRLGYQEGWMEALRQVSAQQVAAGRPAPEVQTEEPEETAPPAEEPKGRLAKRWARRRQLMRG
jgi:hypothetical protein